MKGIFLALLTLFLLLLANAKDGDKSTPIRSNQVSKKYSRTNQPIMLISPGMTDREGVCASRELIDKILPILRDEKDPFVILSKSETRENSTYLQTLWNPEGFYFEYQEKDLKHHYGSDRDNLSLQEITEIFHEYLRGDSSWKMRFKLHKQYFYPDGHESFYNYINPRFGRWSSKQ